MNYLDVYFSRINHMGETTAERIRNGGIRSFEKWLAESPHTIRNLSVERGIYFDGIILTSKDKEYEKIMFLEVANNIPLLIGDIMNWTLDDGSIEKWILIQEEKKVNGTFRSFWIVRCNYLMKWIDAQGHLNQSWAYFVSSLDSKIKGNFRTWNNLITPQPNKYAELLMPRYPIDRATNFIVEEESWTVVEYDHTSVPGVIYLSLTEGKINIFYDDLENNIADTDKLANYKLEVPPLTQIFHLNDVIEPKYTLTKNGIPIDYDGARAEGKMPLVEFISTNTHIVKNNDGVLIAVGKGEVTLIAQLIDHPKIQQTLVIKIGENEEIQDISIYIEGPEKIRLDRKSNYFMRPKTTPIPKCTFTLFIGYTLNKYENDGETLKTYSEYIVFPHPKFKETKVLGIIEDDQNINNLAKIKEYTQEEIEQESITDDMCTIYANDKNKLGYVVLKCEYNNYIAYKIIEIIPLW